MTPEQHEWLGVMAVELYGRDQDAAAVRAAAGLDPITPE